MMKKNFLLMGLLVLSASCSSWDYKSASRNVADERGRDRDRGERREGFEIGDYTSQRINNNSGFIDVSDEFSRFRGLLGKNFKGLLIEAVKRDDRPGPGGPGGPGRDDRRDRFVSEIIVTLDQRPVERFLLADTRDRQVFYVDLNRELGDKFGKLNIQFNPRNADVRNLTVLTNDERPWDQNFPRPPRQAEFGVIFKNTYSNLHYFGKGQNSLDAEFAAKSACQQAGYAGYCTLLKSEMLTLAGDNFTCSVKNTYSNLSFGGTAPSRLEAEALTYLACQKAGYPGYCAGEFICSNGQRAPGVTSGCLQKNTYSNKTFFGKGLNEVEATLRAKESCQADGYPGYCSPIRCESGVESFQNFTCVLTNNITSKSFRGDARTKIEAEAVAKKVCETAGYPGYCGDVRCSN